MSVNVAAAGPIVCIWLLLREGRGDLIAGRAGRFLAWKSLTLQLVGGLLGLALGATLWNGEYAALLDRFQSKVFYGILEYFFSLILLLVAAAWWQRAREGSRAGRVARAFLLFLVGTNTIYHFPILFFIISDVRAGFAVVDAQVSSAEFRSLIMQNAVLSQFAHFCMASFAMVGATLMGFCLWHQRGNDAPDVRRVAVWGGRLALGATIMQLPIGIWLTSQLPAAAQRQVLGADLFATSLLGISVVGSFSLLHQLSAVALGDTTRRSLVASIALMMAIIILMTGVLIRI